MSPGLGGVFQLMKKMTCGMNCIRFMRGFAFTIDEANRKLEDWQDGEHEPMCKLLCHVLATND